MLKKILSNKKGLTLIEMLVVLVIVMFIFAMTLSFTQLGVNTFVSGDQQFDLQSEMRIVNHYIVNNVRYATQMEILATPDFVSGYQYIHIDSNGVLTHYDGNTPVFSYGGFIDQSASSFSSTGNTNLTITLQSNSNVKTGSPYQLVTDVGLLNIGLGTFGNNSIVGNNNKALKFKADEYTPPTSSVITYVSTTGSVTSPVSVPYGTSEAGAVNALSSSITVSGTDSNGTTRTGNATISWIISSYDGNTAENYTATGTVSLPGGWLGGPAPNVAAVVEVLDAATEPPVVTTILVTGPNPVTSGTGGTTNTYQYTVTVYDQYGDTMAGQSISWTATGMGGNNSISSNGLLSLRNYSSNSTTITATSGSVSGSLTVTVN